jgi:peptidyl-prolyl cis-trans isomerase SurA
MAEKFKCFLASQNGVKISDAQVNQAVEKISKANKVKVSFFKDLCRKAGVPYETFLDQIAAEKLWESYIIQKYRSQIVVSPSDLAAYRESIKVLEQMPSYQLIEIILDASGKLSPEVLQARFQNMVTALQEGMPLDVAVAQFSDGPLRGQKGYLGWVSEADLPREARSFLRQQGASSFSPPIKTPHGNVTYFLMTPPQRGEKLSEEEARQRLFIMRLDRYAKRELDPLQREPVGKISMGKVEFLKNLS